MRVGEGKCCCLVLSVETIAQQHRKSLTVNIAILYSGVAGRIQAGIAEVTSPIAVHGRCRLEGSDHASGPDRLVDMRLSY